MPQSHDDIRVHQNYNPVSFLPGRSADGAMVAPIFRVGNLDAVVTRIRNFSEFSAASTNAAADIARIHTVWRACQVSISSSGDICHPKTTLSFRSR